MAEGGAEKSLRKIAEAFQDLAETINSQDSNVKVASFSHACSLFFPLLRCLGIVFKFAEIDFATKVNNLAETSDSTMTLRALIDQDVQANTVRKLGSRARNLLRVKRGLDLLKVMFEQIIAADFRGDCVIDAASTAYEQVFAPYHGWAIRKAVGEAKHLIPTLPQFMVKLNDDVNSARPQMESYVASSKIVIEYIENLFLSRELGIDW